MEHKIRKSGCVMKEITIPVRDILAESRNMSDYHRSILVKNAIAMHLNPQNCKILVVEDKSGFYITVKGSKLVKVAQESSREKVNCVLISRDDIRSAYRIFGRSDTSTALEEKK